MKPYYEQPRHSSRSDARKAASAQIAKIPLPLSLYVGRAFKTALPASPNW